MKKLLLTGIAALFLATGAAHAGCYYHEDKWTVNCRMEAINKTRPDNEDLPENIMIITREDLPELEKTIKDFKKCIAFWKCTEDRAAGKVKHCAYNDKRW